MRLLAGLLSSLVIFALLAACSGPSRLAPARISPGSAGVAERPTETPAATPAPTGRSTPSATPAPASPAATPSPTVEPTAPPTPAPTPKASSPTPSPSPTPAATPAPATPTSTPPKVSTPTPVPTKTATPQPTQPAEGGSTIDPRWEFAVHTQDGASLGVVTTGTLNVRSAPRANAPVVATAYGKHPIPVYGRVTGDAVGSNTVWYRVGKDQYVTSAYVEPFVAPKPATSHSGHWVDINLSSFYLVAYDGKTPIYAAIVIVGKEDHATPTGEFKVQRRVADETMDAGTLGVPKSSPDYYYLPHVLWTQYFTNEGHALHTNYWSQPWQYGTTGSHGCINLQEPDAHFLWSFLTTGSAVSIHY